MTDRPLFEIRITTSVAGTILRAATERLAAGKRETGRLTVSARLAAGKAEEHIRRAHQRGSAITVTVAGRDAHAVRRLDLYLTSLIVEIEQA